jgi:hypothetical protein
MAEESLASQLLQQEVKKMVKTYADMLREEGRKKGELRALRRTLLEQLEERFLEVPAETQTVVKTTTDPDVLRLWLKRFANAHTLEDVQIGSP